MIKVDFHMHTVATPSDADFEFSMATLKAYVSEANLDAIAITNHNMFDLPQFLDIREELDIAVFPAIEINLDKGHLLLLSGLEEVEAFSEKCSKVTALLPDAKDTMSVEELHLIFGDLRQYILIPHYDKHPSMPDEVIEALSEHIDAGEVSSPKKFMYCLKNSDRLVPLFFSDSRMSDTLKQFPVRQTYLACGSATFADIKGCLKDKNKVFLSETEANKLFTIFPNGQKLSTGLNVVLGDRSSGKSYTLNQIEAEASQEIDAEAGKVKYLKQFSLVERDDVGDKRKFDKLLSDKESLLTSEYLSGLQEVVSDVVEVDLEHDRRRVGNYIESLIKYAKQVERHDAFSKARLFSEETFPLGDQENLEDLIASTKNLINNVQFKEIIEKHISIEGLKALVIELMTTWTRNDVERRKKKWINGIISEVRGKLQARTAATSPEEVDFYSIVQNMMKVSKFSEVVKLARTKREVERKSVQGFEVVASTANFDGAMDLRRHSRTTGKFSEAFSKYNNPYSYLQELKGIEELPHSELYKFFVKIEYKILNRDGYEVSGGERSEFNLLQEIQDAQKYDLLLIDEPESSFDNQFLKKEVNELIRAISRNMPVVLVTHNATVGASIQPDYILYTKKEVVEGEIQYRVYSGYPTSKDLVSPEQKKVSTYEITLGCLEAGEEAYSQRRKGYEDLKN
ncbi:MAG: phosphotransferase [Alphaproteobacteria bacterium]|nr:MAG: phosphotransferase [Alphaproteobacteria bacterium]